MIDVIFVAGVLLGAFGSFSMIFFDKYSREQEIGSKVFVIGLLLMTFASVEYLI